MSEEDYEKLLFEKSAEIAQRLTTSLMGHFPEPSEHIIQVNALVPMMSAVNATGAIHKTNAGIVVLNSAAIQSLIMACLVGGAGSLILMSETMEISYIRDDGQPIPVSQVRGWAFFQDRVLALTASELMDSYCQQPDGTIIAPPRGMEFHDAFEM